jgi:phage gp37-like protein
MYNERRDELDKGIESFVSTSAATNASMAAGDLMKNRSAVNQMAAGAKMGNPVDIAALNQFRMDSDAQTSQRMTALATTYNQNLAGLHMNKAGTMNQAAGVRNSYDNQASNIYQAGIQMNAAAHAQAANHEANGLSGYANMISNNPWTPVAFLPTLMSFFQFSQTTGSSTWGGMNDSMYSGITDSNNY